MKESARSVEATAPGRAGGVASQKENVDWCDKPPGPKALDHGAEFFPVTRLRTLAPALRKDYLAASPYPHVVVDGVFDTAILQRTAAEFPTRNGADWTRFADPWQIKLASNRDDDFGPLTRLMLYHLNAAPFLDFLAEVTGITGLVADSHYEGGGMHQIERGGKLAIHADFNKHPSTRLDRRLNALLYLNDDWRDDFGGDFEMWDKSMSRCVKKVAPKINRLVVFATTESSYHGHPDALTCPPDMTRKSLALYYYTNGRPAEEVAEEHTTVFKGRPGEAAAQLWSVDTLKRAATDVLPPVVARMIRRAVG
jgi:hypothetical protein